LGSPDGTTDNALLDFLVQQKWASAYEKNQTGQHTVVIQNTGSAPNLTLPALQQAPAQAAVEPPAGETK
jgi:hypothetical protein